VKMFPTQTTTTTTSTTSPGKTLNFDFETGEFVIKDGKVEVLTGIDGLKMWVKKVLKTEKNKFKIYNTTDVEKYGISLMEIVASGHPLDYIKSQLMQEITDTLVKNPDITSVYNFAFNRDVKRKVTVSFTISSIYGTTGSEVTI